MYTGQICKVCIEPASSRSGAAFIKKEIPRLPKGVWLIAATSTVLMSGFGMIVPLIPIYGHRLGASAGELGFLMAGLFIGRFMAQIPAGLATDRLGRKPVLLGALLGYTLTCVGYALAFSPNMLIIFRILQGLSAGFFSVAARSLISDLGGSRLRGTAQGIYSSSVNFGFVLGPVIGPFLVEIYGIDTPFWVSAGLSALALISLSTIAYPARKSVPPNEKNLVSIKSLTFCGNQRIAVLAGTNLCFMAGLSVIMTLFPVAGETEIDGGLTFVGIAFSASAISGLLFGPIMGRLSDRMGRSPFIIVGVLLAAAEGTTLFFTRNPMVIGIGFFLGGIGAATYFNSLHATISDLTIRDERGTTTGFIGLAGESGGIIGSLLAPFVWVHSNLKVPFGCQIVLTAVAVCLVFWFWKLKSPGPISKHCGRL